MIKSLGGSAPLALKIFSTAMPFQKDFAPVKTSSEKTTDDAVDWPVTRWMHRIGFESIKMTDLARTRPIRDGGRCAGHSD